MLHQLSFRFVIRTQIWTFLYSKDTKLKILGPKWQKIMSVMLCISIIWLSFMVHMCKMIFPGIFFIFSKFLIFLGFIGVKGQKMALNDKNCICHTPYNISGSIHHMILIFGTRVKWWHLQVLLSFSQDFDFRDY